MRKRLENRRKKKRVVIPTDIMPKMAIKRNKDGKLELFLHNKDQVQILKFLLRKVSMFT